LDANLTDEDALHIIIRVQSNLTSEGMRGIVVNDGSIINDY